MEIFKTILNITTQLIILYSYLVLTTENYMKIKIPSSKKCLTFLSCLGVSIILGLLSNYFTFLIFGICILAIILTEKFILNYSNNATIISILVLCTSLLLGELSAYVTNKFLYNALLVNLVPSSATFFIYTILKCIFISFLFSIITLYLSREDSKIMEIIEDFKFKDLLSVLLSVGIIIISSIITLWLNISNTDINILAFSIFQIALITTLIFLHFKYIHFYNCSKEELAQSKLYNKTLSETNDRLRLLKHDYNNILQSINGYIITKQYAELDNHIKELIANSREISNLECISPKVINQPAIYGIVGEKYFTAQSKNISFNIEVFADISSISFDFTKLSRILGILLDNAIEAAEKAENPSIDLKFSYSEVRKSHVIEIKNTFEKGKKIDTTKIFEKGESSKKKKSGLGLWEVKKIISSCKNASICASVTKNDNFVQTLLAKD